MIQEIVVNKKELIALQKEWYKKLKEDGFQDIEYFDSNMEAKDMMYREATKFAIASVDTFTSTEQYYIEARQFLHSHSFLSNRDKIVWTNYTDGLSYRKIGEIVGLSAASIMSIVKRIEKIMLEQRLNSGVLVEV